MTPSSPPLAAVDEATLLQQKKLRRNARDRSRSQLKKTTMEAMRKQVAQLEETKRQLELRCPSLVAECPPSPADVSEATGELQAQYLHVLQQIERLRQENRKMALDVLERDLFRSAVQNLLDAREKDVAAQDDARAPPPPPPMPEADAAEFARRVVWQITSSRLDSDRMQRFSGARVFGWSDFRMRTDASIRFTIKKTFQHQTAHALARKTWAIFSDIVQLRRLLPPNLQCDLREVQRLNDDVIIFDRTTTDPQFRRLKYTSLRTTYMLVRSYDGAGSCSVGMKTIDLPVFRAALAEHESWCDIYYWFHLEDVVAPNGDVSTSVLFGGALSYFNEDIARAWLAELVFLAVRWETKVVAPVLLR